MERRTSDQPVGPGLKPRTLCRPNCHETDPPRITPPTSRPSWRSMVGRISEPMPSAIGPGVSSHPSSRDHPTVFDTDDPVCAFQYPAIMCHHDGGCTALPTHRLQHCDNVRSGFLVQRGGRLVSEDDFRIRNQSAGDSNPLFLPPRKALGKILKAFSQANTVRI